MRDSNCRPRKGTFLIFIESYAKHDFFADATGVLDMMEKAFGLKPGSSTYNFLLNFLVDGKKFKLVESVHSMMFTRGVEPGLLTFNILLKSLCQSHQISSMPALIHGYCKEGRIEEALNFAEEMLVEGFRPNQFTFDCLVRGLCKSGHVKHALELLDLMLQEGFDPDIFTYNTLIFELCKSEAMEVLKKMISRDCSPNTVTYNTLIGNFYLIRGLCLTKNHNLAIELFHKMKNKGCRPNAYTYNILIDSLCLSGKLDRALGLLKDMESSGCARDVVTDKFAYSSLINGLCMSKKMEKAMELMDQMILEGLQPDVVTYGSLINGWWIVGVTENASRLLRTIETKGMALTSQTYNPLICAFFEQKRTKEAMRLFREMEEKGNPLDAVSYNTVFQGIWSGGGPIGEAVNFLVEMTEKRIMPESSSFCMLADGLCALSMETEYTLVMVVENIVKMDFSSENEVSVIMGLMKIRKFQDVFANIGRILKRRKPKRRH
ncbi:hypothetical protein RHSIM_Rhsim04G0155600 [Rhododendron simsii]|uniref:Pentatricopeptide repeat-containing protein n=1 Tax=Rhododendron simsii TaxID=118357 RepID=A0A834H1Q4_RHOSS|nr:hypothetical protein RHSIM_Rhsim04G0155600 [Rhododendron simsii]